jgi:hypothetical protein
VCSWDIGSTATRITRRFIRCKPLCATDEKNINEVITLAGVLQVNPHKTYLKTTLLS